MNPLYLQLILFHVLAVCCLKLQQAFVGCTRCIETVIERKNKIYWNKTNFWISHVKNEIKLTNIQRKSVDRNVTVCLYVCLTDWSERDDKCETNTFCEPVKRTRETFTPSVRWKTFDQTQWNFLLVDFVYLFDNLKQLHIFKTMSI